MATRITVSALALASRCIACYVESYVLGKKRGGPHLLLGRAVHRAIELYERSGRNVYVGTSTLEAYREVLSPEAFAEARRILAAYDAAEGDRAPRARYIEAPVECRVGPLVIHGRVDRVDEWRGELELVDYKTGRRPDLGSARLQCTAYALGLLETFGRAPEAWTVALLSTGERRKLAATATWKELHDLLAPVAQLVAKADWRSRAARLCARHRAGKWKPPESKPDLATQASLKDRAQQLMLF